MDAEFVAGARPALTWLASSKLSASTVFSAWWSLGSSAKCDPRARRKRFVGIADGGSDAVPQILERLVPYCLATYRHDKHLW